MTMEGIALPEQVHTVTAAGQGQGHSLVMVAVNDELVAPFDDVRVRQAIRLVTDRQAMVDLILKGAGTASCDTPVEPSDPYRWNPEGGCPQDIEGAKALLAAAGYADGLDLTQYTSNVLPNLVPMGESFQQQAAATGIHVDLKVVPAGSFFTETAVKEAFITTGWLGRPTDEILNLVFRSTSPLNEAKFVNEAFDQLLDEAARSKTWQNGLNSTRMHSSLSRPKVVI